MKSEAIHVAEGVVLPGREERDPSFNATFLGPAVWYLGVTRVLREYDQVSKGGDEAARSAVFRALYHTCYDKHGRYGAPRNAEETAEVQRLWRELGPVADETRTPTPAAPRKPWWKIW